MDRDFVTRLFAQSLEQTQKLVEPIACEDCASIKGGKHPAWIFGHHIVGADFASQLCGAPRGDGSMDERYVPGSTPLADRSAYPTKSELLAELSEAHAHATEAFKNVSDDVLAQPFPMEDYRSFFPRVGDGVVYLLAHHEPYHLGQLQQWAMSMGLKPSKAEG